MKACFRCEHRGLQYIRPKRKFSFAGERSDFHHCLQSSFTAPSPKLHHCLTLVLRKNCCENASATQPAATILSHTSQDNIQSYFLVDIRERGGEGLTEQLFNPRKWALSLATRTQERKYFILQIVQLAMQLHNSNSSQGKGTVEKVTYRDLATEMKIFLLCQTSTGEDNCTNKLQ